MIVMQRVFFSLAIFFLAASTSEAHLMGGSSPNSTNVSPHIYIIKLRNTCTLDMHFHRIGVSKQDTFFRNITYLKTVKAYFGYFPPTEITRIGSDSCITKVTHASEHKSGSTHRDTHSTTGRSLQRRWTEEVQKSAPWNLKMISQGTQEELDSDYSYDKSAGAGVHIHGKGAGFFQLQDEFQSQGPPEQDRALVYPGEESLNSASRQDYGSCFPSIVIGERFGVAKRATYVHHGNLAPVKIFQVMQTLNKVISEHMRNKASQPEGWRGSVVLFSDTFLWEGTGPNQYRMALMAKLIKMAKRADKEGILIVAPAGDTSAKLNGSKPFYIPCQLPGVVCVGGVTKQRRVHSSPPWASAFGAAVTLWAPGDRVECLFQHLGAEEVEPYELSVISTKAAAAHVAGTVALFMGYEGGHSNMLHSDTFNIRKYLIGNAKRDWILGMTRDHGRNLLLNTGIHSARGSEKPFADVSELRQIEDLIVADRIDLSTHEPVSRHAPSTTPFCFNEDTERRPVSWDIAQKLYFRMLLERAHLNIWYPDAWIAGNDVLIPCHELVCVYLHPTEPGNFPPENIFIKTITRFEKHLLHIINLCRIGTADMTGGTVQVEGLWNFNITLTLDPVSGQSEHDPDSDD